MTAEEFLQKLAQADLAPPEIVETLRRQVAAAKEPIAAAAVAKLLVEKGHLTGNQAQRLLGSAATSSISGKALPAAESAIQKKAASSGVQKTAEVRKPAPAQSQATPSQIQKAAAAAQSSSIHSDVGLSPLDDHAQGSSTDSASALAGTSNIHSGIPSGVQTPSPAHSAALSGSHVLDNLGLAPLDGSAVSSAKNSASSAKTSSKAASGSSVNLDDGLALAPDDGLSHKGPPPGSLAAKILEQKAAEAKQNAAESGSAVKPLTTPTVPKPKPAVTVTPVALEELTPLDDLGTSGLDPLDNLAALEELSAPTKPTAAQSAIGKAVQPAPQGGFDPLSSGLDPLGGPADLGALAAQTATPHGQPTPAAVAAATAASDSRTTLLVGLSMGGAALLVVLIGLVIYFWPRGSGELEFAAAEQAYQEKQYAAAIEKYEALLKLFPRHDQASLVRVHHGMCRIQEANPASGDWSGVLPRVRETLGSIAAEPALAQVHAELAPLLIQQCESLTESAAKLRPGDELATRLQEAQAALALCNDARLLPTSLRPWQKLAQLEERLQALARDQAVSSARDQAKATLAQHAAAGKVADYLAERGKLLEAFPESAAADMWRELGVSLADSAIKGVKVTMDKKGAVKDAPALPYSKAIPWQSLSGVAPPAEGDSGRMEVVCVAGALYGLDFETGNVRWIHYAGLLPGDGATNSNDGNTVWLVDRVRQELVCLSSKSGAFVWSQPLASPAVGKPLLAESKLLVSLSSGTILSLDAVSGELLASAMLPQPLSCAPSLSADGKQLFQVADESLAYVLNADTLHGERAVYLGHSRGAVRQPPVALSSQAIVATRQGEQTVLWTVPLSGGKNDVPRLAIDGANGSALVVSGKRLLVPTDTGRIYVLEITGDEAAPLRQANSLDPPAGQPFVRHLAPLSGGVCATGAGSSLLRFDSQGKLEPAWSALGSDACDVAASVLGDSLIVTHYNASQGIAWATAIKASDGLVLWQKTLRCALQLVSAENGEAPLAVPLNMSGRATETIGLSSVRSLANYQFISLGAKRFAIAELGQPELLLFETAAEAATLPAMTKLDLPGSTLAGVPAQVGQHLLVPLADGAVQCLEAITGKMSASPYILPAAGSKHLSPMVLALGQKGDSALVFDGERSLVKITRADQPQPHWAEQAAARTQEPLIAPPTIVGEVALAIDIRGVIHTFALADLAAGPTHELRGASAVWGPHACGQVALAATDNDELICIDNTSSPRWQQKLVHGGLVGRPIEHQSNVVVTSGRGMIEVRSLASGEVVSTIDVKQPLAGSGHLAGNSLWLTTAAGQVLQVTLPSGTAKESP